ncbi:hypothetical protein CSC04_3144 [Enterobacter roggenkampii]|nr:hypothetical protein CSC04_3144 [Enterobacter roggenkampii]
MPDSIIYATSYEVNMTNQKDAYYEVDRPWNSEREIINNHEVKGLKQKNTQLLGKLKTERDRRIAAEAQVALLKDMLLSIRGEV